MDVLKVGWFSEVSPEELAQIRGQDSEDKALRSDGADMGSAWLGQAFSLKVDQVLFKGRSQFQDVIVFKSTTYGNVLVLDNVIQCTERDECSYQEMLTHLPMFAHPDPQKVLIIGGGDGGILREVLKHECVQEVHMCEIDDMVIEVSKKYLKGMSCQFDNAKLKLFIEDGFKFLQDHESEYDVIITDSSDPIGPAESLFGQTFYELINKALKPNGVLASQGESYWLHLNLVAHMVNFNRRIFSNVQYASSVVSTYPSGVMGYLLACKGPQANDLSEPKRTPSAAMAGQLKFYTSELHKAAFVLPAFVQESRHDMQRESSPAPSASEADRRASQQEMDSAMQFLERRQSQGSNGCVNSACMGHLQPDLYRKRGSMVKLACAQAHLCVGHVQLRLSYEFSKSDFVVALVETALQSRSTPDSRLVLRLGPAQQRVLSLPVECPLVSKFPLSYQDLMDRTLTIELQSPAPPKEHQTVARACAPLVQLCPSDEVNLIVELESVDEPQTFGAVQLCLQWLSSAERLTVTIQRATSHTKLENGSSFYWRIFLCSGEKVLKKKKSSTKKPANGSLVWNEAVMFGVEHRLHSRCALVLQLVEVDKNQEKVVGKLAFNEGPGPETRTWRGAFEGRAQPPLWFKLQG